MYCSAQLARKENMNIYIEEMYGRHQSFNWLLCAARIRLTRSENPTMMRCIDDRCIVDIISFVAHFR